MEEVYEPQKQNLLFGQFLIEKKLITSEVLNQALDEQEKERSSVLQSSERMLGQILLQDHGAFNRMELVKLLKEFNEYKIRLEDEFAELKQVAKKHS